MSHGDDTKVANIDRVVEQIRSNLDGYALDTRARANGRDVCLALSVGSGQGSRSWAGFHSWRLGH
jgi:hypothetical protein